MDMKSQIDSSNDRVVVVETNTSLSVLPSTRRCEHGRLRYVPSLSKGQIGDVVVV